MSDRDTRTHEPFAAGCDPYDCQICRRDERIKELEAEIERLRTGWLACAKSRHNHVHGAAVNFAGCESDTCVFTRAALSPDKEAPHGG